MSGETARARGATTKSENAFRTISEVSAELDLPQHVLRFWETRFSQIKPMKRNGGRRLYRPDHIALLKGIKALLYDQPEVMARLLEKTARAVTAYLNAQIEAGAQAVMIFDTWGGSLAHDAYPRFSLQYAQQIIDGLIRERDGRRVPVVFFTKGGGIWLETIAGSGADALGIDWTLSMDEARRRVGGRVALQGNLDPSILYARPAVIEREVGRVLSEFGTGSGHVFNLGHGVHPQIPPEHVEAMVNAVRAQSPAWHA